MFAFKKILTAFLLPPGVVVVLLLVTGVAFLWMKKRGTAGFINLLLGALLWAASISPVSDFLVQGLEAGFDNPTAITGDVILLLGGGTIDEAVDMTGKGFPSDDMLARIITAVRLQRRLDIPVLITSGKVFPEKMAGAAIVKRLMMDLGVPGDRIFLEEKSRDTAENARYSITICRERGWKDPILLTSSIHLNRSVMLFERYGLKTKPFPAYLVDAAVAPDHWSDFLPHAYALADTAAALHEYLGICYYRFIERS